ncbi:MAG: ketoacyl-ACP synthase III [Nitrospinae bacterium]|nr:ketoacyl-ACP synthase III [Nitrospinota bacterium]
MRAKIIGTGSYVPEKVITNYDLEKMVDTTDEWIRTRTGMVERRIASNNEAASDLAIMAAKRALKDADVKAKDIEMILLATATPDMLFPSTACIVQTALGIKGAAAFDISAACTGFIYALSITEEYIKSGKYKTILLITTELLTRYIDWTDRSTCILFGDGASAMVIQGTNSRDGGVISTHIHADGSYADFISVQGGGSRCVVSHESVDKKLHFMKMKGNETFKMAVKMMTATAREALSYNGFSVDDINLFIPHQANIRIINAVSKKLGIAPEKIYINIEKYGNTSAVSIPLALDEVVKGGRLSKGDLILMVAFGGGLTWGSALVRW